jgi:hypothetical protein
MASHVRALHKLQAPQTMDRKITKKYWRLNLLLAEEGFVCHPLWHRQGTYEQRPSEETCTFVAPFIRVLSPWLHVKQVEAIR